MLQQELRDLEQAKYEPVRAYVARLIVIRYALGMALNCLLYPKFGGTWGSVGPLDRP